MYNKLASIILNSAKNKNYAGEVFISQPDAAKEKLAGKIFVLAELEGYKGDSQKIINFLINFFDYNYYGDEKILLRDKIEGLKIENIFEGVLARVNKGLIDFLQEEHFKINPQTTNITLGVVYENKLYFSNYGKNKAFLIFRRRGNYEIINVEASAADEESHSQIEGDNNFGKIFSAVINGEIPEYSYFFFANEALPEYLSNKELVEIVTKLPPMVAAEQIKNSLQRINSFAPFLGIIIKSTLGLNVDNDEAEPARVAGDREYSDKSSKNAHSSISHLNYTERKTERMLAPAGIISLKKIINGLSALLTKIIARKTNESPKVIKLYDNKEEEPRPVNFRETLAKKLELTHRESFAVNDKLVFKKKASSALVSSLKSIKYLAVIFSPSFWAGLYRGTIIWLKSLNKKNQMLVGALALCLIVLVVSVWVSVSKRNVQLAQEQFQQIVDDVNGKQAQVDAYMLYGNQTGALAVLNEATNLLQSNVTTDKDQLAAKATLFAKIKEQKNKIQKISEVSSFEEVISLNAWGAQAQADNLSLAKGQLYLADSLNKAIYTYTLADSVKDNLALSEQLALTSPAVKGDSLYYAAGSKIVKITGRDVKLLNVEAGVGTSQMIQFYKDYLYFFNPASREVDRFTEQASAFSGKSVRLTDDGITGGVSFNIDDTGAIFVAKDDSLLRFFAGKPDANFKLSPLDPTLKVNKVIVKAKNIYILDLNNSRLVNFDLVSGGLVKQYLLVKDNIKDFVISDDAKSAYILAGSSIYKFSL